ncbi:MAG: metallophosphoesterase family protein, partial [Promethearchaeota archaeon]
MVGKSHFLNFLLIFMFIILNLSILPNSYEGSLNIENNDEEEYLKVKSTTEGYMSPNELFWFIQISDTQFIWNDLNKLASFYEFLNETYREIKPLFIYHTGDINDANFGLEQDDEAWKKYKKALEDNNMNASIYMDVMGNHDASNDPYFTYFLNFSMMGRSFNATQFSFNHSFAFGEYAFIGLNTAKKSYNIFEFGFQGYLNSEELDWYEAQLEKYKEFDKIFVFGHHPPSHPPFYKIKSEVTGTGRDFYELNDEYNVSFYLSGHIHENVFQYSRDLLTISTSNFDQRGGTYRIVSLDHDRLSTSIQN